MFIRKWKARKSEEGVEEEQLPAGDAGSHGEVYVTDPELQRIVKLDAAGKELCAFEDSRMCLPIAVKVRETQQRDEDDMFVLDIGAEALFVAKCSGRTFTVKSILQAAFISSCVDFTVLGDYIYLTDLTNHCVQVLSLEGTTQPKIGAPGRGSEEFYRPWGITSDPERKEIYISDNGNDRIQVINEDGEFIRSWGCTGEGRGELMGPKGIVFQADLNIIAVADSVNDRVLGFDALMLGCLKWEIDEDVKAPYSLTFDKDCDLLVLDQIGAQWFAPPGSDDSSEDEEEEESEHLIAISNDRNQQHGHEGRFETEEDKDIEDAENDYESEYEDDDDDDDDEDSDDYDSDDDDENDDDGIDVDAVHGARDTEKTQFKTGGNELNNSQIKLDETQSRGEETGESQDEDDGPFLLGNLETEQDFEEVYSLDDGENTSNAMNKIRAVNHSMEADRSALLSGRSSQVEGRPSEKNENRTLQSSSKGSAQAKKKKSKMGNKVHQAYVKELLESKNRLLDLRRTVEVLEKEAESLRGAREEQKARLSHSAISNGSKLDIVSLAMDSGVQSHQGILDTVDKIEACNDPLLLEERTLELQILSKDLKKSLPLLERQCQDFESQAQLAKARAHKTKLKLQRSCPSFRISEEEALITLKKYEHELLQVESELEQQNGDFCTASTKLGNKTKQAEKKLRAVKDALFTAKQANIILEDSIEGIKTHRDAARRKLAKAWSAFDQAGGMELLGEILFREYQSRQIVFDSKTAAAVFREWSKGDDKAFAKVQGITERSIDEYMALNDISEFDYESFRNAFNDLILEQ